MSCRGAFPLVANLGWRRSPSWRALCLALLAFAAAPSADAADRTGLLVGRVLRVQDGDSFLLDVAGQAVAIRLAGIDAPELNQPHGREARDQLRICTAARTVVVTVRDTDRHQRPVGTVEAGGHDCALNLLRSGLAWVYPAYLDRLPVGDRQAYAGAESAARSARRGLWTDAAPQAPWAWRREH